MNSSIATPFAVEDTDGNQHVAYISYEKRRKGWYVALDDESPRFVPVQPGLFPTANNLLVAAGW